MVKLGKTVILGDSYSTFAGYIPEGNVIYYSPEDPNGSRVTTVEQTWWHQLIAATDSELVLNESWSGSTIGYTGYEREDYTHLCFNTRLDRMHEEGTLDGIDTLLIFGGTNDDWCGAPEGELKFEGWTKEDMYCALPAIGRLFCRVAEILPDVNVYAIINTELKPCINDGLIEAATRNGVKVIRLHDIDKIWGHPSDIGMTQIKDQLLNFFENEENKGGRTMKLLSIGNSFSQDAQEWLHQIAVANGVELETTNLMIGGCSLETHWNHITDGESAYYLEQNGQNCNRTVTLPEGLALDEWDVITVQQVSHHSGQPQTYIPFLTELVAFVRQACPKAKIYFHQTWAYEIDSDHGGFVFYNRDQQEMYRRIGDCTEMACRLIGAQVLPSGPVVQYLRENTPEFDYKNGGLSLNRDGFHLSWDYGRYAAAATWYKVLTGKTPAVNAFPEWDAHLIDVIHAGVNAVVGE